MRWIGFLIVITIFAASTFGALVASAAGWGLPGLLEEPVNVREASVRRRSGLGGPIFFYSGRTHYGGGYRGGK
jgi:hypothetical protein